MSRPRIIGGAAKGRVLETPRRGTRPSPARLREGLFNILGFRARGKFLDLYSGSGAIGLEAASRGWDVTCVDLSREAAGVIRKNARATKLSVDVVQGDALRFALQHPHSFDVVFAAPPYPLDLGAIFQQIVASNVARGLYVFQHPKGLPLLMGGDLRTYGSNALSLLDANHIEAA